MSIFLFSLLFNLWHCGIYLCNGIIYEIFKGKKKAEAKAVARTAHKNAVKMSMSNMQRTLTTSRVSRRCWSVMTRSPECFNNKIKMALLILIWTTIWCRRESVAAERHSNQAVYNNINQSNLQEQLEINILNDNEDVKAIRSKWNEMSAAVAPIEVADEHRSVQGEQLSANNANSISSIAHNI